MSQSLERWIRSVKYRGVHNLGALRFAIIEMISSRCLRVATKYT